MTNDATTNVGFKGPITSAQLPLVQAQFARYAIQGAGDLKVTAAVGTRALKVAGGSAWGDGILSTWGSTDYPLNGTAVASSGYRWDTVYIRRTWQPASSPTGKAEITLVPGAATKAVYGRTSNAGVTGQTSDQPLALVRFDYGSNAVTEIVDLRVWGANGGLYANTVDAVNAYAAAPGTQIRVGDVLYCRVVDASSGATSWSVIDLGKLQSLSTTNGTTARIYPTGEYGTGAQLSVSNDGGYSMYFQKPNGTGGVTTLFGVNSFGQITAGLLDYTKLNGEVVSTAFGHSLSGYAVVADYTKIIRRGDEREMFLGIRSGANRTIDAYGQSADLDLFDINAEDSPRGLVPVTIGYRAARNGTMVAVGDLGTLVQGFGYINASGLVRFSFGAPNWSALSMTVGSNTPTFYVHAKWSVVE